MRVPKIADGEEKKEEENDGAIKLVRLRVLFLLLRSKLDDLARRLILKQKYEPGNLMISRARKVSLAC